MFTEPSPAPDRPLPASAPVVVVGGGQSALATAYHLRRHGLVPGRDVLLLDAADRPGGMWPRTWDGLRLFSPAGASSLPGWMMPPWDDAVRGFPPRDHVVDYLTRYEERYDLRVHRPVRATEVLRRAGGGWEVRTDRGAVTAAAVVSATGTWTRPFVPAHPGLASYAGRQVRTVDHRRPEEFAGQHVLVVGGGNSAAQILAEVSTVARTTWVTLREPRFLPDDVDGRVLFSTVSQQVAAARDGAGAAPTGPLGDVVMVDSVKDARARGVLHARRPPARFTRTGVVWPDGTAEDVDAVVWCTGFRPDLRHLRPLHLPHDADGHPLTDPASPTRVVGERGLHLVGYGTWTGPASATLVGVGQWARLAAGEVVALDEVAALVSAPRPRT